MSSAMNSRGMPHGLKLDTHGLNTLDFTDSLRTAPPAALFSHQFSFNENMLFGPGPTINPSALHYDSPQMLGLEPPSPFNHGLPDMGQSHSVDDSLGWLTGMTNVTLNESNDIAVDGSSPSALSSTSQSNMSDVMVDGSNNPAVTAAATSAGMWAATMAGIQPSMAAFGLDTIDPTAVFPDLLGETPVSPPLTARKSFGGDNFFQGSARMNMGVNPQMFNTALFGAGAGPETPSSMNGNLHGSSPVSTITDSTRNAILVALSQTTAPASGRRYSQSPSSPLSPRGSLASVAHELSVPSLPDLQRYVGAFLSYFHPHLPLFHLPTISFDIPAASSNDRNVLGSSGCLVLSMAAIGALYELEHEPSRTLFGLAKRMLKLYLDERTKANVRKADLRRTPGDDRSSQSTEQTEHTPLWLVQAMLLNVIYGHNCADRTAGEIASIHCTALVSLADGAELTRVPRVEPEERDVSMGGIDGWADDGAADDHAQWIRWKTAEERKRTLYVVFTLSSLLVAAFNHPPALTNSEIFLDLPCDEDFFAAPNAVAFKAIGGIGAANHNRISFRQALGELLQINEKQASGQHSTLNVSTFGSFILINALHNYIWETRHRHVNKIWTNEETEMMHRHLEPALKAWHAAWARNPQHSIERPNPFGAGPLSADAIPLLDLAYVRLFVDMSKTKERFWQRDWDGLAEELARGPEIVQHADHSPASNTDSSATDQSDNSLNSSLFIDSPPTQSSSPEFSIAKFPAGQGMTNGHSHNASRATSRREKHLRKAAFYAAESLAMSDKLGITYAEQSPRELPLHCSITGFDCAQVLAEWVATLQDRVGMYLGVLGRDEVDLTQVPAIMLLEDEDVKLLDRIEQILTSIEAKLLQSGHGNINTRQYMGDQGGYAARILLATGHLLGKSITWPVVKLMIECLEHHACRMRTRAEKSLNPPHE